MHFMEKRQSYGKKKMSEFSYSLFKNIQDTWYRMTQHFTTISLFRALLPMRRLNKLPHMQKIVILSNLKPKVSLFGNKYAFTL